MGGLNLKGWIKDNNEEQKEWMTKYLLKRKLKLTNSEYASTSLINWSEDSCPASEFIKLLDVDLADNRELLQAMRNAWDKKKRDGSSHLKKKTYRFTPACISTLKRLAKNNRTTIEKQLEGLIFAADNVAKNLKKNESIDKRTYLDVNRDLRAQNKKLSNDNRDKKTSLKKLENQVQNLESKLKESKASELKALSLLDCEKKKRK
ncbi:hypothetical protein IS519_11090 [Vibrio crassostreae]|uniref:hypothetical protein n=1 Tax=Vibrio crassostreae TaxID=246167 RepID=UPI00200AD6C9|nr:hypothetical protein [Vibrio crassostreae]UPR28730.1 hypothetical protein IS519_11090 [Vibrio crassostreae]